MEIEKPVSAETAMAMLDVDQVRFWDILEKDLIPAYQSNPYALFYVVEVIEKGTSRMQRLPRPPAYAVVDVEELLENKKHAVLKRRVWGSAKAQWRFENHVPGWNTPDNEDFGGPMGRAMFMTEFGFQQHNLPTGNPQMKGEILGTLSFEEGGVAAYKQVLIAAAPTEDVEPAKAQGFDHNEDFTKGTSRDGVPFGPLTPTQAAIIRVLYEESTKTPACLREKTIRRKAALMMGKLNDDDDYGNKIKDVYKRDKAAYDALIERVRPGVYQLKV
jgi:hypothetical protein